VWTPSGNPGGVVGGLTRALSALLRHSAWVLPAERRQWAQAAWADSAQVPAGRRRLEWLIGGLWMAAGQARMMRRIGFWLAFGAAAAGVVRIGWPGTAASPVTLVNRVDVITIVLILTGLPWAASRLFGRVGSTRTARAMRTIGYAVIFALVLVKASVERFGIPPQGNLAGSADPVLWAGENVFLLVMAAYTGVILAVTARRSPAAPATLAIGTGVGAAGGLAAYTLTNLHIANPRLAWVSGAVELLT
jgi:hypothetical protein